VWQCQHDRLDAVLWFSSRHTATWPSDSTEHTSNHCMQTLAFLMDGLAIVIGAMLGSSPLTVRERQLAASNENHFLFY
jgi:hypothetical protein